MHKAWKIAAILSAALFVVVAVSLFSLYRASQQVPRFYREALALEPQEQRQASDRFIAQVTALASDLHGSRRWQRLFTAQEINAWLGLELANDYPELLSGQLRDPRITIRDNEAIIACRYDNGTLATVLSLSLDVYLQEPHVLAIRIRHARAGALPVPLGHVLEAISHAAGQLKLRLEWRKSHGDPVALVTLSDPSASGSHAVELQTIELRNDELYVAGKVGSTKDVVQSNTKPNADT
ncbi:MAG TPA: hypothetical protein VHV08_02920, partial [Pirellulales bacterium]|nr:hypothetical protein [Pirellulales bacterium]